MIVKKVPKINYLGNYVYQDRHYSFVENADRDVNIKVNNVVGDGFGAVPI